MATVGEKIIHGNDDESERLTFVGLVNSDKGIDIPVYAYKGWENIGKLVVPPLVNEPIEGIWQGDC